MALFFMGLPEGGFRFTEAASGGLVLLTDCLAVGWVDSVISFKGASKSLLRGDSLRTDFDLLPTGSADAGFSRIGSYGF